MLTTHNLRHLALMLGCGLVFCLLVAPPVSGDKKVEAKKKAGSRRFPAEATDVKLTDGKAIAVGELSDNAPLFGGFRYRVFAVQLEKGKTYRFELRGGGENEKFAPFLVLEDAAGKELESGNERVAFKPINGGLHRIITTTARAGMTGKCTLEISPETDAAALKEADLKHGISTFESLSGTQRANLVRDLSKRFRDKGEDLTANDFQLAWRFSIEAEDDPRIAREVLNDYLKTFGGASNKSVVNLAKRFESSLRHVDTLGKPIDITGKLTDGKDFDLKSLKGKVVLVDFWATWCGPCVAELPNMQSAYTKYHKKGFEIIGISLDRPGDEEKLTGFIHNRGLAWPCINIEDSRKLADRYKVNAIPHPVLVDQAGNVVSFRARGPQLERLLERLLGEKK